MSRSTYLCCTGRRRRRPLPCNAADATSSPVRWWRMTSASCESLWPAIPGSSGTCRFLRRRPSLLRSSEIALGYLLRNVEVNGYKRCGFCLMVNFLGELSRPPTSPGLTPLKYFLFSKKQKKASECNQSEGTKLKSPKKYILSV